LTTARSRDYGPAPKADCAAILDLKDNEIQRSLTGIAIVVAMAMAAPAQAEVAMSGTFTATQPCPAYQSFRKETNPGDVKIEPSKAYDLIAKNKPDATHYRVVIDGADPRERWVAATCGTTEASAGSPGASKPEQAGNGKGTRATHVLAMSWQPAFCETRPEKPECHALASGTLAANHLSLHGLWPQPRGKEYCNVAQDVKARDRNRDWESLPAPEMSAETQKRLAVVMPGVQSKLERHEWIVHGTCFGTDANVYFERSATLAEAMNASQVAKLFADNTGKSITADAIRAAFDASFGVGAGQRVTISCKGQGDRRMITELIIGLAGDVTGKGELADLIQAADARPASCPGGLVDAP
jgi:ribonuclease T2